MEGFIETFASLFSEETAEWPSSSCCFIDSEAQLVKLINPFLLDPIEKGGLGLTLR